jgi:uroporphyrinogen-III synthase
VEGLHVGVTGARKAAQLAAALERRGAVPVLGPLVTSDQPVGDAEIVAATDAIVASEPRWLAASTGVGMRLWREVAARHGRAERLHEVLDGARRVARGAKAVGGLVAAGLDAEHVTDEETDAAVVTWLRAHARPGDAVAVQLHGGDADTYATLAAEGFRVHTVRPYVAGRLPDDEGRARRFVRRLADHRLDVVTFTSPGAARNLFALAAELGEEVAAGVEAALRGKVAVAVIGPVTAEVFHRRGIPVAVSPDRHRQGELVRAIERWAIGRA